jgi:cold shock protein
MERGTVFRFDNQRGFGWIDAQGRAERIFVHFSAIKCDGFKSLAPGDEVVFGIEVGPKGPRATDVVKVAY